MRSILIAGGDMRQIALLGMLKNKGHQVSITGFEKLGYENDAPRFPEYVFLPVPYRDAQGYIRAPYANEPMVFCDIAHRYPACTYVLGGCDDAAKAVLRGARCIDLMENEAYLLRNAQLTAQGAVCAYLKHSDAALCDADCVVTGYGRIAKFLCRLLDACGARITVAARKDRDLALIAAARMRAVNIKNLADALARADVIFNTVPHPIFGETELAYIKKGARYIELASPPYGADLALAEKNRRGCPEGSGTAGPVFSCFGGPCDAVRS